MSNWKYIWWDGKELQLSPYAPQPPRKSWLRSAWEILLWPYRALLVSFDGHGGE